MKYGLALEGGGAKGAYQIGALKALIENNVKFEAVTGTSIGSINAALFAQGDFKKLYEMWSTLSYQDLFYIENSNVEKIFNLDMKKDTIKYISSKIGKAVKDKGVDTSKIRSLLEEKINEEKLRKSDIKFGLVTYCISDNSPREIFIDDIPEGQVVDYIMASSNLPVFKRANIEGKLYLDGGIYDNCPVRMLEQRGCKEVYAIRAFRRNRIRGYKGIIKRGNTKIHMIQPRKNLPGILDFRRDVINEQLKLGYYDALRHIKKLEGYNYYFQNNFDEKVYDGISNLSIADVTEIIEKLDIECRPGENVKVIYIEKVLPYLVSKMEFKGALTNKEVFYSFLEHILKRKKVDKYDVYDVKSISNKYIMNANSTNSKIDNVIIKILNLTLNMNQ